MPTISETLLNFDHIKVASNESIDYYTLNRVFNKIYDITETVVSSAVSAYEVANIPYSDSSQYGYVQFASEMLSTDNDNIIGAPLLSAYIDSITVSTSAEYIDRNRFKLYNINGSLLNGLRLNSGYSHVISADYTYIAELSSNVISGFVEFTPYFTSVPTLFLQLLDGDVNSNKFSHKYAISSISPSGFDYYIYTKKIEEGEIIKQPYFVSWFALGV